MSVSTYPLQPVPPRSAPGPRSVTLAVSMLVTSLLVGVLTLLPAPYVVDLPGPTWDVLSSVDDTPTIAISGAPTYPTTGQLRMVTVSEYGSPGYPAYALNVMEAWLSPWSQVNPAPEQPSTPASQETIDKQNEEEMVSSQEQAVVAALTELGMPVPAVMTVAAVVEGSGSDGVLQDGDQIVALDGTDMADYESLIAALRATTPGATVQVGVLRDGARLDLPVVTTERDEGGALLGVQIDPTFDPPVDVSITVDGVGGPSAGTMFALGIMDLLTPQDELDGVVVAGTGTIDVVGDVGPIGGIAQKMAGAQRDGAAWFLAPADNCADVVGHVPDGLRVVRVATLHEAWAAVGAIGAGQGDSLPTCS